MDITGTINDRLRQLVDFKTDGSRSAFAELCGWSKQYFNRLINDKHIGIQSVATILRVYPDVNARWLILGDGKMIDDNTRHLRKRLTSSKVKNPKNTRKQDSPPTENVES